MSSPALRWLVFSDPGFQGMVGVLQTGVYPFPETWGFPSPFVGSLRPLKMVRNVYVHHHVNCKYISLVFLLFSAPVWICWSVVGPTLALTEIFHGWVTVIFVQTLMVPWGWTQTDFFWIPSPVTVSLLLSEYLHNYSMHRHGIRSRSCRLTIIWWIITIVKHLQT